MKAVRCLLCLALCEWIAPVRTDIKIHLDKSIITIRSVEASFGESLPFDGLYGRLISGAPLDGCSPLEPAPSREPKGLHWFVLLERSSNCTFEDKVISATKGNFSAAIIFNNKNNRIFHMGGSAPGVIPSVLVGLSDGLSLLHNFSSKAGNVSLVMYPDEPFDLNVYLLPFAIVIGICFLLMLGIVVFKCVQDHRRNARHRLPKSALKNLPIIKYVKDSSPYDTCCICLDDYLGGDRLRVLPCDHAYHKACIDPWLVKNRRICPQCRKKVFWEEGSSEDSGGEGDGESSEWDSLLRNARSSLRNSGTFQAGGTYAAARADQMSSSSSRRASVARGILARMNPFGRRAAYRRLGEEVEEEEDSTRGLYIDNTTTTTHPSEGGEIRPSTMMVEEDEEGESSGSSVLHVAIVHSQVPEESYISSSLSSNPSPIIS